jgi:hypothetical protein
VTPDNEDTDVTRRGFMYSAAAGAAAIITPNDFSSQGDIDGTSVYLADKARRSFMEFRKIIRPTMIWNPFVYRLTRELQRFCESFERGERPKLAICTPPQHGKSTAAEDFAAWMAGRCPDFKTIYASYSDDLGIRTNLNLQRLFSSRRCHDVFPDFMVARHTREAYAPSGSSTAT